MVLEKSIVSCEDDSIREQETEGSGGVLLPVLMNMPWVDHNGRERLICSCSLCAPTSCPGHLKGRETREKGEWLADSCRALVSPSISPATAGHLPATGWGSCPGEGRAGEGRAGGSSPQVLAQPTRSVSQNSSSRDRQEGEAEICRPLAHSPALRIAGRW